MRYVGAIVVNDHETSCPIASGGSFSSTSVTFAPEIVTVQLSFPAKSVVGSSVNVRGPPVAVASCVPLSVHSIENHSPVADTSSPNVTLTFASNATSAAFAAGVRAVTLGA